jgi:hypothetical protein
VAILFNLHSVAPYPAGPHECRIPLCRNGALAEAGRSATAASSRQGMKIWQQFCPLPQSAKISADHGPLSTPLAHITQYRIACSGVAASLRIARTADTSGCCADIR